MRIEYHRTLIADEARNAAFHAALQAVIVPGKTIVADIGAGTGLLGIMAAKLGAKEVYLFETAAVAAVAAEVIKANKVRNCHLIPCHSTEFQDALAADVIVSETLGNYALEENIIDTLNDARHRFLNPGGMVIPRAIHQYVAPVVTPRFDNELRAWDRIGFGLDLSFARMMSFNNVYVRSHGPDDLLSDPGAAQAWDHIDLTRDAKAQRKGTARWPIERRTTIYGYCLWWSVDLTAAIHLSTAPGAAPTHWEQLYFPLAEPIRAAAGDAIDVSLRSRSSEAEGTHLAWTATHFDGAGRQVARYRHDLDKGYLP
jgi:hypothetical protein